MKSTACIGRLRCVVIGSDPLEDLTAMQMCERFGDVGFSFWHKLLIDLATTESLTIDCGCDRTRILFTMRMRMLDRLPEMYDMLDYLADINGIDRDLWQARKVIASPLLIAQAKRLYRSYRDGYRDLRSNWYELALRMKIEKELQDLPEIEKQLSIYKSLFVKWCAKRMTDYEISVQDAYDWFNQAIMSKRLYGVDYNQWKKVREKIFKRDDWTCKYCGKRGGILEVDHIIPISKNGTNHLSNLTTACRSCNRQKRDKTISEFNKWKEARREQ